MAIDWDYEHAAEDELSSCEFCDCRWPNTEDVDRLVVCVPCWNKQAPSALLLKQLEDEVATLRAALHGRSASLTLTKP
jgi:hypothetical protein